jgi:hypothetical protein
MRGADPVTVSDRREALHGSPEQATECLGLCLAKLRILGGDVRYRAMMLAELVSAARGRPAAGGGRITIG